MYNNYIRNLRNYPHRFADKPNEVIHKPIPLGPANEFTIYKRSSREDGWESIDRNVGTPHPLAADSEDDTNDWGGIDSILNEKVDVPITNSYKNADYYAAVFREQDKRFNWLIPGILAGGPHPFYFSFENDLSQYKKDEFKAILSVCEEPLSETKLDGFEYYFMPTNEDQICDLRSACKFIDNMEKKDKPVFVHCFAGTGRTGTVLAAYMIYKRWLTANEAISHVRLKYSKYAIETTAQEASLHTFALLL